MPFSGLGVTSLQTAWRVEVAGRGEKEFNIPAESPRGSGQAGRAPRTKGHGEHRGKERDWRGVSRFSARIIKKDSTDSC